MKENDEVRAATCSCGIFASRFSSSSEMPSEKYSWSLSGDMSANGSTAIEAAETPVTAPALAESAAAEDADCVPTYQAPASSAVMPTSASTPAGQRCDAGAAMIWLSSAGVASAVLCIPSGVMSNAHARTTAKGKPRSVRARIRVMVHSGSPRPGSAMSATCRMTKATAPYTAITRNTRRRLSSAKKRW